MKTVKCSLCEKEFEMSDTEYKEMMYWAERSSFVILCDEHEPNEEFSTDDDTARRGE